MSKITLAALFAFSFAFSFAAGCKGKKKKEGPGESRSGGINENGAGKSRTSPAQRGGKASGSVAGLDKPRFPSGFSVVKTVRVDSATLDSLSRKLGGRIVSVVYHYVASAEVKARVNVMKAASDRDASAISATLVRKFKGRGRVSSRGAYVVEFVGMGDGLMHRFR